MIIRYALLQVKRISLNVEAWVYQNVPSYTYTHLHIYTHTQKTIHIVTYSHTATTSHTNINFSPHTYKQQQRNKTSFFILSLAHSPQSPPLLIRIRLKLRNYRVFYRLSERFMWLEFLCLFLHRRVYVISATFYFNSQWD